MVYKAVIFDLDGTLLNTLADIANSMNSVLQKHGLPVRSLQNYRYYVGEGMAKLVENVLEDLVVSEAQKSILLQDIKAEYSSRWMEQTKPYDGIAELFSALSIYGESIQTGILSNKPDTFTKEMAVHYFPHIPFSQVRGALDHIPQKPNPQAVFEMAENWKIATEEIIFVGDTDIDMKTAKKAGCFAAGAVWGFRTAEELLEYGADVLLEKPLDLMKVLK
ncbi:MAG: HAD family hydrolase [Bacteroidia bacterium]